MDIDIDTKTGFDPSTVFPDIVQASMLVDDGYKKHNVGWYFQNMPSDPVTNLAAIPYDEAEQYGFFKIDFLSINVYDNFNSKSEIRELLKLEPNWDLLLDKENYLNLFQIHRYFDVVSRIRPRSIPELADCIALIRPGPRSLLDSYVNSNPEDRIKIRPLIYDGNWEGFSFKKSHAHAYALTIVLQLHLIDMDKII